MLQHLDAIWLSIPDAKSSVPVEGPNTHTSNLIRLATSRTEPGRDVRKVTERGDRSLTAVFHMGQLDLMRRGFAFVSYTYPIVPPKAHITPRMRAGRSAYAIHYVSKYPLVKDIYIYIYNKKQIKTTIISDISEDNSLLELCR